MIPVILSLLAACAGGADLSDDIVQTGEALSAGTAYTLENSQSHLRLDVGGREDGAAAVQNPAAAADAQQWRLQGVGGGYSLINVASGLALTNPGASQATGTRLTMQAPNGSPSQVFKLDAAPGGTYELINAASSLCVDNSTGSSAAGNPIQQWTCAAKSSEMMWKLAAVDAAAAPGNGAPTASAPAGDGSYTVKDLQADLTNVLQSRGPVYSNRNLGNPANVALWTPDKLQSLYRGIVVAQKTFFPTISLTDLAHIVVAEGAQESSGNLNMPGWSVGFIQATPSTVGVDYRNHGTAVGDVLTPATAANYLDPAVNIAYWAWYGYNVVAAGESLNEVALGNPQGGVTRDLGNCLIDWNQGPHVDRWGPGGSATKQKVLAQVSGMAGEQALKAYLAGQTANTQDYLQRVADYFVQAKFGTPQKFMALLNTATGAKPIATK